jgi:hypothetical protein
LGGSLKFRISPRQSDHFPIAKGNEIIDQSSTGYAQRSCHQGFFHRGDFYPILAENGSKKSWLGVRS